MKHCTDAELLCYLDGETAWRAYLRVRLHLLRCWHCRAHAAELESQAHRLSRALLQASDPSRTQRCRAGFEAWRWRYEQSLPRPSGHRPFARYGIAAAALLTPVAFLMWPHGTVAPPEPRLTYPKPPEFSAASRPLPVRPLPVRSTPPPDALSQELDVHYRLHRIRVCAAEPVLIARQPGGRMLVSAVGPPASREREIREALADLVRSRRVKLAITPSPQQSLLAEAAGAPAAKASISRAMWESSIPGKFGTPAQFVAAAAGVLAEADRIYASAWALKRHQHLPVPSRASDTSAFWLRQAMLREHIQELTASVSQVRRTLKPLLRTSPVVERLRNESVFDLASQLTASLQRFFQTENPEDFDPRYPGPDELWATLQALEMQLAQLDRSTARSRPGSADLR